ncbi:MAG TPA: TIM barrel protein, partial [Pirellulaceae bacterium]
LCRRNPHLEGRAGTVCVHVGPGFQRVALRFVNLGSGVKHVVDLSDAELATTRALLDEYGLRVSSLGSPLGKVKLYDFEDGTSNRYVPFEDYLAGDVEKTCRAAKALGTRLIRGFTFYPPRGSDPRGQLPLAVRQLRQIADICTGHELILGLELEAHLVGRDGLLLAEIFDRLRHPDVVLVFDPANLVVQGYGPDEVWSHFEAVRPGLGWLHVKDCLRPVGLENASELNEEQISGFVPAGLGDGALTRIFDDLRVQGTETIVRMTRKGVPGILLELEPHLRGGGQFGGTSGADGFGVAFRHCTALLDAAGLTYRLTDWPDLRHRSNVAQ